MDFGRWEKFVLLRNMVELDFGRFNYMYYVVTWYNGILVDWTKLSYFVLW